MTTVSLADRENQADMRCAALAADPISLADGPVARLSVLRLAPDDHRAVLVVHRVAADDRSLWLLTAELSERYQATSPPRPARPAVQYTDYTQWQRRQPAGRLADWWKSALTPLPAPPALPADWTRTGDAGDVRPGQRGLAAGGSLPFVFGAGLCAKLTRFCRAQGTTQDAVVLAALQAVLSRYGAQDRVPVCVPASLRPAGFADVIGPFDNLLVVCGDLAGDPSFGGLARRVSRAADDAFRHRALPFASLVRALDVDHDPDRIPLGDVVFDYRRGPGAELALAGAEVSCGLVTPVPAGSDLVLTVRESGDTAQAGSTPISGTMAYRGGRPERAAAALVLGQLRTLLSAGLAAPDTPVSDLPLDAADRSAAIARAADRTSAGPPGHRPVHELIRLRAAHTTGAAVAAGRDEISYPGLLRRAALIARGLRGLGVRGSAVAIRMPHGAPQLAASLATLQAGGQLIWLDAAEAGERVRSVLAERRPACLLIAGGHDPLSPADPLVRWYRDELGGRVVDVTAPGHDDDAAPGPTGSAASGSAASGSAASAAGPAAAGDSPADQVVYIAHTSGTTGKPKGIAQTHGAFAQFATWLAGAFELGPGSRVAQWVTADHDPSLCEVFATLVAGGTLCPVPGRIRMHPEKFLGWLATERITFLQTVPSFARELCRAARQTGAAGRLGALSWLVLMGESLPGDLARELLSTLPGTRLANLYGPTETIAATWCEITPDRVAGAAAAAPIGEPIPGREVLVLDEADRPCPAGVTGELVIRSPHVTDGYAGLAAGAPFRPVRGRDDGIRCYRTGDLARRRPDGLLEFRGRRDQQVKLAGNRLELAEVEAALAAHASVAECAVVPRTGRDGLVIQLVAYVVPRVAPDGPDGPAAAGVPAWRAHLRARFGRPLPVSFETLAGRLPRTVAGKVDRRRLPVPSTGSAERAGARTAERDGPGTAAERDVARLWSELTGSRSMAADQSFFTAGGHSLLVPELLHRVRERYGVTIPLREFFGQPTIAAMAARVCSPNPHAWPEGALSTGPQCS